MASSEHSGPQHYQVGQKDLNAIDAGLDAVAQLRHTSISTFSMRIHESIPLALEATRTGRMRYSEQGKVVVGSVYLTMLKEGLWVCEPRDLLDRIQHRLHRLRSQVVEQSQTPNNGATV